MFIGLEEGGFALDIPGSKVRSLDEAWMTGKGSRRTFVYIAVLLLARCA